jgi:hypothetical protein
VHILASLSESELVSAASKMFAADVYGCATVARSALALLLGARSSNTDAAAHVQHLMWCAWRTACWKTGSFENQCWRYTGMEFASGLEDKPVILITPMTMPFHDILSVLGGEIFSERTIAVYGEGLSASDFADHPNITILGGRSIREIAVIVKTLEAGGIFCTYPDFVYSGHSFMVGRLFGQTRKFSQAFISICLMPGVHLLPVLLYRDSGELRAMVLHEPVTFGESTGVPKNLQQRLVLETVVRLLENAISIKPEQWLLLNTLVAEVCETLPSDLEESPAGRRISI